MSNSPEKTERPVEELSFEEALEELEALTTRMTTGEITLRESVAGYERGRALLEQCQAELKPPPRVPSRLGSANVNAISNGLLSL